MKRIYALLGYMFYVFVTLLLSSCHTSDDDATNSQNGVIFLADKSFPQSDLYHSDRSGKNIQQLNHVLPEFADISDFQVSPNGKFVAYRATSGLDGINELYVAHTDGSNSYKVSGTFQVVQTAGVGQISWSSDSTKIAYIAIGQDNNIQRTLYVASIDSDASVNITPQDRVYSFLWSPDSRHISYVGDKLSVTDSLGVYIVDNDSQIEIKVSGDIFESETIVGNLSWSPDGLHLLYAKEKISSSVTNLYTVKPDGTENINISNGRTSQWVWAPDSSYIAYFSSQDIPNIQEVYTVLPDGSNEQIISRLLNDNESVSEFHLSPDSSQIVYLINDSVTNTNELYVVIFENTQQIKVSDAVFSGSIAWAPNSLWLSYLDNSAQLFIAKPEGTNLIAVSNLISVSNPEIVNHSVFAFPVWSPDSNNITFQVSFQNGLNLYTFNPNNLTEINFTQGTIFGIDSSTYHSVKWFGDGKNFVYHAAPETGFLAELYSASIDTGFETNITDLMGYSRVGKFEIQ